MCCVDPTVMRHLHGRRAGSPVMGSWASGPSAPTLRGGVRSQCSAPVLRYGVCWALRLCDTSMVDGHALPLWVAGPQGHPHPLCGRGVKSRNTRNTHSTRVTVVFRYAVCGALQLCDTRMEEGHALPLWVSEPTMRERRQITGEIVVRRLSFDLRCAWPYG